MGKRIDGSRIGRQSITPALILLAGLTACSSNERADTQTAPLTFTTGPTSPAKTCPGVQEMASILLHNADVQSVLPESAAVPQSWLDTLSKHHSVQPAGVLTEVPGSATPDSAEGRADQAATLKIAHALGVTNNILLIVNTNMPPGTVDVHSGYATQIPCVGPQNSGSASQNV